MRLKDKVVVVTGSTKGIGRGIAITLAKEGARVVVSGRNEEDGQEIAQKICASGGEAVFMRADVAKVEDCRRLIDETVKLYGRIDGLVNNAGIFPHIPMMETSEEIYDSVMDIDAKGAFFCTQQALQYMMQQRRGSVVNIGSTHWLEGAETLPVYSMAKGALHTLTKHVAAHFGKFGVRSNWITVGWVLSEGEIQRLREEEGLTEEGIKEQAKQRIPLGRYQTAEDMAYACIYLLSDESEQVTSTEIEVTGGFRSIV